MKNVNAAIKGNILTLTVDLSKDFGQSKTGKSTIVATTSGNASFGTEAGNQVKVGLNVYRDAVNKA